MPKNLLPPQKGIDLYFKVTVPIEYSTPVTTPEERNAVREEALNSLRTSDGFYAIPKGSEHDSSVWHQY